MADIFLSYAKPNAALAARFAHELQKSGYSIWYDRELPAHRAYADVIAAELEVAQAVLVLWSEPAVKSQWVRSEANRARELGKLVQARIDGARLPMPFDQIQCADLAGWRSSHEHAGWSQIERSIGTLIDGGSPEQPRSASRQCKRRNDMELGRREVLAASTVALGAVAIGAGWWATRDRNSGPPISPETSELMEQAKTALWQNTPEGQNQSIGIYRQVIAENPSYAEAWGRLSMAYAIASHWRQSAEGALLRERARSAAQRALDLDTQDKHALVGLAYAMPYIGNWLQIERDLIRALALAPKDGEIAFALALVMSLTGRNREALDHVSLVLPGGPTPGVYIFHAQMLWSAGRQDELDALLDEAMKLYPTHFGVWFTRFYTDMMGGRPDAALALAAATANRPTNIPSQEIDAVVRVAKAIQSRSSPEIDAIAQEWMERAHHGAGYAENAAQFMASLGRADEAFAVLRAYFFSEGFDCGELRFNTAIGSYTAHNDRQTAFLFYPAFASLRSDARFGALMSDIHLSGYWRASGHLPDYLASRV